MKRQLVVISVLTAASQLAAFFKLWFTARIFGVGVELDGYNLALILPTLIAGVMGGLLQTGLFPVRARLNADGNESDLKSFERAVFWGIAALGVAITVVLMCLTPVLVPALGNTAAEPVVAALRYAFPLLAGLVALTMISDCAGYLLAMRGWFPVAAAAPIINGLIGGALLAAWPELGLANIVAGTLLGLLVQLSICVVGLKYSGLTLFGPIMDRVRLSAMTREIFQLGLWILPGVVFANLIGSLATLWVSSFGEGAVSAFGYAQRLHSSAVQLLIMASSSVILAHLSELVVRNDHAAIKRLLGQATIASAAIGLAGVAGVYLLGAPVLAWTFGGRFDAAAASRVAEHWLWMTLALGPVILGNVFAKLWQSRRQPMLLSGLSAVNLLAFAMGYFVLRAPLGEYSISAALFVSALPSLLIGAVAFTRERKAA